MLDRFIRRSLADKGLEQTSSAFPERPDFTPYVMVYSCDAAGVMLRRYDALAAGQPEIVPGEVNWVRVVGTHDPNLVRAVAERFSLHPLLVEDILATGHRPVLEDYESLLFILLRLLSYDEDRKRVRAEQVCLVSGEGFLLTFQDRKTNLWDDVAERLEKGGNRQARRGQEYLTHALIADVLDEYILTLGRLSEDIEELEQRLLDGGNGRTLTEIYELKREVLFLHRSLWPLREVLGRFVQEEAVSTDPMASLLWSDIQQDVYQVLDAVETLREMLSEMVNLSMTKAELRMNAVGQYLTLVATIFLPLNFLVGFYGMNFDNLPFKSSDWGVYVLMGLMALTVVVMTLFFHRKRWLRAQPRETD